MDIAIQHWHAPQLRHVIFLSRWTPICSVTCVVHDADCVTREESWIYAMHYLRDYNGEKVSGLTDVSRKTLDDMT